MAAITIRKKTMAILGIPKVALFAKFDMVTPPAVLNVTGEPLEYINPKPLAIVISANVATKGAIF